MREQSRFIQTNALIEARIGRVETILELGSGEGHQSEHLSRLCRRLDGVDVSARAVQRAQEKLPNCRFGVGEVTARATKTDERRKPEREDFEDGGAGDEQYEEAMSEWPDECWDTSCDYKLLPETKAGES